MSAMKEVFRVLQNADDGLTAKQVHDRANGTSMNGVCNALSVMKARGSALVLDGSAPSRYVLAPGAAIKYSTKRRVNVNGKRVLLPVKPTPTPPRATAPASLGMPAETAPQAKPTEQRESSPRTAAQQIAGCATLGAKLKAVGEFLLSWPDPEPPRDVLRLAVQAIREVSP